MAKLDYESICKEAIAVIKPIGKLIKKRGKSLNKNLIEQKGVRDFVTEVDKEVEKKLVDALKKILPQAGFITEEKTVAQTKNLLRWIIDPIDGTTNFIHGTSVYAISVALMCNNEIVIGIVFEVTYNELFYTWKNAPSFLNGKKITVSKQADFSQTLVATGFPYSRTSKIQNIIKTLAYFLKNTKDVRRLGSAATDLCYVACGRFDVYYEGYLQIWDIAAGILIVKNAEGKVTDFTEGENYEAGFILATNKIVHQSCLKGIYIR